jgi:hypothetical protein
MFNKLSGWGGSASADQASPRSQEAQPELNLQPESTIPQDSEMEGQRKHRHRHHHRDGTQEEDMQAQEGNVVRERHMVQGAEQALSYLDGIPQESGTPIQSGEVLPQVTTPTTPTYRESTLAVYQPPSATSHHSNQAPAGSTALVTVKSISQEERDRQIHEENMRK